MSTFEAELVGWTVEVPEGSTTVTPVDSGRVEERSGSTVVAELSAVCP